MKMLSPPFTALEGVYMQLLTLQQFIAEMQKKSTVHLYSITITFFAFDTSTADVDSRCENTMLSVLVSGWDTDLYGKSLKQRTYHTIPRAPCVTAPMPTPSNTIACSAQR